MFSSEDIPAAISALGILNTLKDGYFPQPENGVVSLLQSVDCVQAEPAWEPAARGEPGSRIKLGTAQKPTAKAKRSIRTNGAWLWHKGTAMA